MAVAGSRLALIAGLSLAVVTAGAAGLALVALNQGGAARVGPLKLLELEKGYDRAVVAALLQTPPDLVAVEAGSRRSLQLFPYDTAAWLRLAYVKAAKSGSLGPEGLRAFRTSYDLVAYDPYVAYWRVQLGLDHWLELSPELRASVIAETRTFAKIDRKKMTAALQGVRGIDGRLAASLLLAEING